MVYVYLGQKHFPDQPVFLLSVNFPLHATLHVCMSLCRSVSRTITSSHFSVFRPERGEDMIYSPSPIAILPLPSAHPHATDAVVYTALFTIYFYYTFMFLMYINVL